MFRGLIAGLGGVVELEAGAGGAQLRIATGLAGEVKEGDSVAVNGVCLTATLVDGEGFRTEAMPETLERSSLASLAAGDAVNLELALRAADRLGGHLVQGHAAGTGTVIAPQSQGISPVAESLAAPSLTRYPVAEGSGQCA